MSAINQQRALVDKLVELTRTGKVNWSEDDNAGFFAKLPKYFVVLREGENANGSTIISVRIEDSAEKEIETFDDEDIDINSSTYFRKLSALFKDAKRSARGADRAIDDILKGLSDLEGDLD